MNTLHIRDVNIDWNKISDNSYLRNIDAIRDLWSLKFNKNITIFVGENGSGKSTLLEASAISYGFNPEGGTRNYSFSTYDSHSELGDAIRLTRGIGRPGWGYFLRAESFYNVASAEEEYSKFGGTPQHFHEHSHGESFLQLAQTNFKSHGIYLLDEPENSMAPGMQLRLAERLEELARFGGCQLIIATHSPFLLSLPGAKIYDLDSRPAKTKKWWELENTRIYFDFFNKHRALFEGGE